MARNSNFSILADVELDLKSIQKQLNQHKIVFDIDGKSIRVAGMGLNELEEQARRASESGEDLGLTFQQANMIMQQSIDIIVSMVEQVYQLDDAITEFKKVSDLSGKSLDNYVDKLSIMGSQVARTGKPKRQAPCDGIVNQHKEPLEIQYSLRAYSTTMVA